MNKWFSKNWLLIVLFAIGAVIFISAYFLFITQEKSDWKPELAKALSGLGMSAIIGGFIKLAFDENQQKAAKAKVKQAFREELLNRLRKIFDAVDGAKLLIEAHKSAKTYGDMVRQNIIPSIVALYDIKRSLKDSKGMMDEDKIMELRIYSHYMIAYLQALANEFKREYPEISNHQLYEEEFKKQAKEKFIKEQINNATDWSEKDLLKKKKLPEPPGLAWQKIEELELMSAFVKDEYDSAYRKMFVNFYEYNKRILKGQEVKRYKDCWYSEAHLNKLKATDEKIESGATLGPEDSVVNRLLKYLDEKIEAQKKEPKKN